jgi:hypothetical protein
MHMREFRIRCVMDFLGMCREEARKIKPGFCTDGTWHQDSGSTYQWAYGNHFDMMCIEGTTDNKEGLRRRGGSGEGYGD